MGPIKILWILILCVVFVNGEPNPYAEALENRYWESEQQYVEVRPGAYLFYWLYYADGKAEGAHCKPLVIWIQGGPGLAATGVANFAELGPLDMNMLPRNHTWVNGRNVLLIDHPVGTGFSYATNKSLYVETDREMAIDLMKAIKTFLRRHKEFRKTPSYIFGQSYGGKIAPRLGYYLQKARVKNNNFNMNLKGIAIGGGWVNPRESILVQADYLYLMGLIDQSTYKTTRNMAREICAHIDRHDYLNARILNDRHYHILRTEAPMSVNLNNINQLDPYPALGRLAIKINRYVKPTLLAVNLSLDWKYLSEEVWYKLENNFLLSSVKFLELLLNKTELKIAVYNGNLDVVTPLAGASNWVHKLHWLGQEEFKNARNVPISGVRNGFYKQARQLSFWSVFGAGHWVPEDNPEAMKGILDHMMSTESCIDGNKK